MRQADKELISTYTEEYEERVRDLLTDADLRFVWERAARAAPKVHCNCGSPGRDCEHEKNVRETLGLEEPRLDALSAARERAETNEVDLRDAPLTTWLRTYMEWRKTQGKEHEGRWVIIHENGVIASQGSPELAQRAAREQGLGTEGHLIVRAYPGQPAISTWGGVAMTRTIIRQDPEIMREFGPCAPVKVTGKTAEQETLALISTGAAGSYIDLEDAAQLGLRRTGVHRSRNPDRAWQFPTFDAVMEIPALGVTIGPPLMGLPLRASGAVWSAIIGRDALEGAELEINGPDGAARISRDG